MKLFVVCLLVSGCTLFFVGWRGAMLFEGTIFIGLVATVAGWLAGK